MTNLDAYNASLACKELGKCKGLPILTLIDLSKNGKLGNAIIEEVKEIREIGALHKHSEEDTKQAEGDFLKAEYGGKEFVILHVKGIESAISEGEGTNEALRFLTENGILIGVDR